MVRRGLVVWLAWLVVGCPSDPAQRDECQGEPDFSLTIASESGILPRDLKLFVEYGGGDETFTLAAGATPQVVFCDRVAGAAGAGGAAAEAPTTAGDTGTGGELHGDRASLSCQLWTEGPARIELTAQGYSRVERDLRVDPERCTTTVELELQEEPTEP